MAEENTTDTDYYAEDYEDQMCYKEDVLNFGSQLIPLILSLVVLSCIGNVLLLIILMVFEKFKSMTNVFILNLALSDLLFTFGLPFWASYFIWGWTFGEIGCKAVKFLFYVGFYSSVLFLTLMTIQRYMAVVHPLSDWEKCRCFSVAPFIIWILSGTAAMLGSHYSKVMTEFNSMYCEYGSVEVKSSIAYFQNTFFCTAFLIMGVCCGRMRWAISKSQSHETHKTVRLTFLMVMLLFLVWAPYNIVMFLRSLTDQHIQPFTDCELCIRLDYAYYVCRLLAFTHCCINPIFFIFVEARFRSLRVLSRRVSCKDLNDNMSMNY